MQYIFKYIILSWIILNPAASLTFSLEQDKKPYDHIMIFNGFGPNVGVYLGMYQAAVDAGIRPDLVIGACGGSIAAAIAHLYPNKKEQLKILESKAMHRILNLMSPSRYSKKLINLIPVFYSSMLASKKILPPIFTHYLLDFPQDPTMIKTDDLSYLEKDFLDKIKNSKISPQAKSKLIIISGKVDYQPEDVGKKIKKVFPNNKFITETIFSDKKTLRYLNNQNSIGSIYKSSHLHSNLDLKSDWNLIDAVRASVPDAFVMPPFIAKNNDYYISGTINLYPIEIANQLGKEISLRNSKKTSYIENKGMLQFSGISLRVRKKDVMKQHIAYWVDVSDFEKNKGDLKRLTLYPTVDSKLKFNNGIPPYDLYRKVVKQQYQLGYLRMIEAMNNKYSIRHLRDY